uniref:Si:dkey-19b23.7 n=1 Tax=Eptatretus burgeri TaxID=7764 RepID=A0A8C4QMD3_EPTBU
MTSSLLVRVPSDYSNAGLGFQHFSLRLRGREELLVTVVNRETVGSRFQSDRGSPRSSDTAPVRASDCSLDEQQNEELLPASPGDQEAAIPPPGSSLFLLAAYARYGRPYVWLRSSPPNVIPPGACCDRPLPLPSTQHWLDHDVSVWDVIADLVSFCSDSRSSPPNPFAIDYAWLLILPHTARLFATGAAIHFLQSLFLKGDSRYHSALLGELLSLTRLHLDSLQQEALRRTDSSPDSSLTSHLSQLPTATDECETFLLG